MSEDGWPVAFPDTVTAEEIQAAIVWHPSDDLLAIDESLVLVPDEDGRPVPMIARTVKWKEPVDRRSLRPRPPPAEGPPPAAVGPCSSASTGGYRAIRYELQGDTLEAVEMLSAPNLEELRQLLPAGLVRREPGDLDGDAVTEHWIVAG